MADTATQNFENHVVLPKRLFIAMAVLLAGFICAAVGLSMVKSTAGICLIGTGVLLQGVGGIFALTVTRGYAVTLQDRIIRAEMRARLEKVLAAEQQGDIAKLSIPQLVGLRFASDSEMRGRVKELADKIAAWRKTAEDEALPETDSTEGLSDDELQRLRSLGYIQ